MQVVDGANRRPQIEHERLLARPVAEIGIERGDEGILARQDGFLEFVKVAAALFQRRRTIAQEGSALKRKHGVQGAICVGGRHHFVRVVHWAPCRKIGLIFEGSLARKLKIPRARQRQVANEVIGAFTRLFGKKST